MAAKRIQTVRDRRRFFLKLAIIALIVIAGFVFIKSRKEALVREGTNFLQVLLSREASLEIHIGKISGRFSGVVRFDDVRVDDPDLPAGLKTLFKAQRIEFHYNLLDFLIKKLDSKIVLTVIRPEFRWRPKIHLRAMPFSALETLREVMITQRKHVEIHVKDLTLFVGMDQHEVGPAQVDYKDDQFQASLPIRHLEFYGNDISAVINLKGHLQWGLLRAEDSLIGQLYTEGSVVNWKPLPSESRLDFRVGRTELNLDSSNILGGLELTGRVDFSSELNLDLLLITEHYPLDHFGIFLAGGDTSRYDGALNMEAHLQGLPDALHVEAHANLEGGKTGKKHYQSMSLHLSGVYPTFKLYDSQLLMEDGLLMKFAEKTVEFRELFSGRTYQKLVAGADQDTVAMGDWEFRRPVDENQKPEFLVERSLGKYARVQLRKYNEPEERLLDPQNAEPKNQMEMGFEYRLRSKDSLQYRVREDEQFVGVERKLNF